MSGRWRCETCGQGVALRGISMQKMRAELEAAPAELRARVRELTPYARRWRCGRCHAHGFVFLAHIAAPNR